MELNGKSSHEIVGTEKHSHTRGNEFWRYGYASVRKEHGMQHNSLIICYA